MIYTQYNEIAILGVCVLVCVQGTVHFYSDESFSFQGS